ncbi:Fic family protein [Virgibacillus byunsanensis]|uniref:Fic family protein n=1 Tax=Virgibacillus byunsanensis TaxID=570945 RepID=A0ABW3LIG1_9BACI
MSKSFVPLSLPINDNVVNQHSMIHLLIEANKHIVQYETLLENTKINKNIFLNLIIKQEAVQSTKIEGTQVTYEDVLEVEAESKRTNQDVQEVLNYYETVMEAEEVLQQLPISTRLIRRLHLILMSGNVRGASRDPGEFRKVQNYIGNRESATFIPPAPPVLEYMTNLENSINNPNDSFDELVRIAIIHAQFETIPPFLDGNGRIGRILIPLYLYDKKVISYPNFFISDTLERDKHKYYRYLNDTRYKSDWNQWITFFLNAVNTQAKKNITLIKDINILYEETLQAAQKLINSSNINQVITAIFVTPVFRANTISKNTDVSIATIRRYLTILEENKIIFSNARQRNKTYYFYELLDVIRG